MRPRYIWLLPICLAVSACNSNGNRAKEDFNAAGANFGQAHLNSGFNAVGQGFSDGANATGDAITDTARKVGNTISQ